MTPKVFSPNFGRPTIAADGCHGADNMPAAINLAERAKSLPAVDALAPRCSPPPIRSEHASAGSVREASPPRLDPTPCIDCRGRSDVTRGRLKNDRIDRARHPLKIALLVTYIARNTAWADMDAA